jgi:mRNA interferase MazF
MTKGDIVLINFPFTNLVEGKLRPAVVLVETELDVTVAFITSQIDWQESSDLLLEPTPENGLKKASLIRTSKIATIDKALAKGLLGRIASNEETELNNNLRIIFKL